MGIVQSFLQRIVNFFWPQPAPQERYEMKEPRAPFSPRFPPIREEDEEVASDDGGRAQRPPSGGRRRYSLRKRR
ncbi:uncharacterized protein LOC123006280 [Tribolium madens]|uniref:uncharacterized protein LOC123006280 n=1 Tax=Tribolium madens TaxID=41895 RepID=UPI001CF73D9D|nr:uncharacterized protein LOC123006280 [Tribolium madens]